MANPSQFVELLGQVRARRALPAPAERRRIREEAGLSLRAVANAVGVSHTAVASWERGTTPREHRGEYAQLLVEVENALAGSDS